MAAQDHPGNQLIRDVMSENVQVLHPGATLAEAARRMKELDVGVLPVCEDDHLLGMVTDRDIVVRSIAHESDPRNSIVADIMTSPAKWCFEDDRIEDCARIMEEAQIRRLAVVNRAKRLVGIVSLGDLARETPREHVAERILRSIAPSQDHSQTDSREGAA